MTQPNSCSDNSSVSHDNGVPHVEGGFSGNSGFPVQTQSSTFSPRPNESAMPIEDLRKNLQVLVDYLELDMGRLLIWVHEGQPTKLEIYEIYNLLKPDAKPIRWRRAYYPELPLDVHLFLQNRIGPALLERIDGFGHAIVQVSSGSVNKDIVFCSRVRFQDLTN